MTEATAVYPGIAHMPYRQAGLFGLIFKSCMQPESKPL
jgi:hypothetical protein